MKIAIDRDVCRGAGICVGLAPDLFDIADDGAVVAAVETVPPEVLDVVIEAVSSCPTRALSLREA